MAIEKHFKRGHPIVFGFIILFGIFELSLSAWLTARFADQHNQSSQTELDRVHFVLFSSAWTVILSSFYTALFFHWKSGVLVSVASHLVFLTFTWLLWTASAGAVTELLGGGLDCSTQKTFVYCSQLNALEGFAWVEWALITFALICVLARGIVVARRGDGYRGSLSGIVLPLPFVVYVSRLEDETGHVLIFMPPLHPLRVRLHGEGILTSPRFNKGTAFTLQERKAFGLTGRLPYRVNTLGEQCSRAYDQLQSRDSDIRKNSFLQSLKDQNWVLYYKLLATHLRELVPIIYTPTEAEAISNYSHLFRRSEGLYLTFSNEDSMEEDFIEQTKGRDLDLIVCSDAEAILGIGDQGVGGIGISAAKSVIYTLIGGIDPARALAVTLDVGTDNQDLLNDPLYVGWPEKRVRGQDYDRFIDKFVQLVRKHFPHSLLHFEDFGVTNAERILEKYRDSHSVFNDDIQGTGAVTLSCTMAAIGVTKTKLSEQRYVIYGAGSAGFGITRQLRDAMVSIDGISEDEASQKFWLIDRHGLITESIQSAGYARDELHPFVRPNSEWNEVDLSKNQVTLLDVVKKVKPTVLIGCSTHAGGFTKEVVTAMAEGCERPIIFPLSNPSRLVEVKPSDANDWTHGKALIATGSPFPPAKMPNGKDYNIAECNNALIYPGLGFGAMLSQSRRMTDTMIIAGARRLASLSPALKDPDDALLPDFSDAPDVNFEVAVAVAEQAIEEGCAGVDWTKEQVREKAKLKQWLPEYMDYIYDAQQGEV